MNTRSPRPFVNPLSLVRGRRMVTRGPDATYYAEGVYWSAGRLWVVRRGVGGWVHLVKATSHAPRPVNPPTPPVRRTFVSVHLHTAYTLARTQGYRLARFVVEDREAGGWPAIVRVQAGGLEDPNGLDNPWSSAPERTAFPA